MTRVGSTIWPDIVDVREETQDLDPTDPDTDDDGYWDGWIGVYDVGYSDNVVLYQEHLESGNGIEPGEMVSEQTGVHEYGPDAPFALGADIDGDRDPEHSKIHLGELHWKADASQDADPTDPTATPEPELTVEVDYHSSVADTGILDSLDTAENTYRLYGLDVTYSRDDELDQLHLPPIAVNASLRSPGPELASLNEDVNHDSTGSAYMFITRDGGGGGNWIDEFDWTDDPDGVASCQGADIKCSFPVRGKMDFGTIIFHEDIADATPPGDYETGGAKTVVHETGHLLGAGRADDGSVAGVLPKEVYSGSSNDDSHEVVIIGNGETSLWSVMSSGWNDPVGYKPMNGDYIAYSIQELSTIELQNIETKEG